MKISEDTRCNYFPDKDCDYQISEETLIGLIDQEDLDEISAVPYTDSIICTNCLLSQILKHLEVGK